MYINRTFFIQSSVEGHFGCLRVLVTVNGAAMNKGVHIYLRIRVFEFFRQIPRRGIAGSYGSFLIILGTARLFSIVAVPVYIPTSSGEFPFLHNLSTLVITSCVYSILSNRCEVVSHGSFDLHLPNS